MEALFKIGYICKFRDLYRRQWFTQSCTGIKKVELTNDVKRDIEKHWHRHINQHKFDKSRLDNKFYVLSMFPYPSGNLHMGHVRVYAISDAVARFQRMCGKNVFHPMGWDAFGLPAENAARQRGIEPMLWTEENIKQMKKQLEELGCSFDWANELSTCDPNYYKWTQKIFLMLYKEGLVYQNQAIVNWDPVDETVLADEQVDNNGCSWRSGAKVQKKLLKQWFIKTTAFAEKLLDGLDDKTLRDWKDIINLQRHWIGECDGYSFHLLTSNSNYLRVWTPNPEYFKDPNAFVVLKSSHPLGQAYPNNLLMSVENPFIGTIMPLVFSDVPKFADKCDVYLAAPSFREEDNKLQNSLSLSFFADDDMHINNVNVSELRSNVLEIAKRLRIGGYKVSSKLQDWLISRQRYWGTPIPIIHCDRCGAVPVPDTELPLLLPKKSPSDRNDDDALKCKCPRCGSSTAQRDTDTMDTFVDSSWYYLRYLDANNSSEMFNRELAHACMPVDLYIGGKEHAVLHLYYARFINQFLHTQGLVPTSEPFSRLLVQGMVMGRTFRVKGSGRYVTEDEVEIVDIKKNQAVLKDSKEPVIVSWEKMSKSKLNGIDPLDMFNEYGIDTTRLILLADVAPTSHRNWSTATFPGVLNWQKRLWLTVEQFYELRSASDYQKMDATHPDIVKGNDLLNDARNYYVKGVTFNFKHAYQLSVAISKMQGLTNSLRRCSKPIMCHCPGYERALATQLVMLAPLAPHFASELWSKFIAAPHRLNQDSLEFKWDADILEQKWPEIDMDYEVDLTIKVNGVEACIIRIPRRNINDVTHNDALDLAFNSESVTKYVIHKKIRKTYFVLYPDIKALLNIYVERMKSENTKSNKTNKESAH